VTGGLQDLIDELAERIGRPVALEDRRWRLLSFSAHIDPDDRVRQASILTREGPPAAAAWLESLGVARAHDLVDTPANDEIGLGPRTCAPVRHGETLLGYLWVIPGASPLDEGDREVLRASATAVASLLWRDRASEAETTALLAAVLDERDPAARHLAADELRRHQGWPAAGHYAVAVGTVHAGADPRDLGTRAARGWTRRDLVWRPSPTRVTVLARLSPGRGARDVGDLLRRGGADHAGAAAARDLAETRVALGNAIDALTVATAIPDRGPVAAAEELGAWVPIARAWTAEGRPSIPPAVLAPLLARRDAEPLLAALEATLDRAGDVASAARALHVHRATLYRRLDRIGELTGLDLRDGGDLLLLHIAVRTWRLARA
jgi:hypothetical protein